MNYTTQLAKDGHLLAKSPRPKKQPKRIPAMSAKRKKEAALYSKKRKAFLEERPLCQANHRILNWAHDNDYELFRVMPWVTPASEEIHHMKKPKQTYFLDESTWLACSKWAHRWIEANKSTARNLGLLCY